MNYDLGHLTQTRVELGPIHDDEAVILYGIVRAVGIERVLELGGLAGYSARNFLAAGATEVVTAELHPLPSVAPGHTVVVGNCRDIADHVHGRFGLVFFDAHDLPAEIHAFETLVEQGSIDTSTVIAVHDTGFHAEQLLGSSIPTPHGWLHQPDAVALRDHMRMRGCREVFLPTFHGLSLLQWTS